MKQWMIVEKRPGLGKPYWSAFSGIGFNSLASAENSRRGTLEALARAGVRTQQHEYAIVEFDVNEMLGENAFWPRLKWAFNFVFSAYRWKIAVMSREAWKAFLKEREAD